MPNAKPGGSNLSPGNSSVAKPAIVLSARFQTALESLSEADFARVESALQAIPDCFGHPHTHSGISIRRLRKNVSSAEPG